ncbi:MAG: DUF998 domain-containing protein [Actinomycetota bacterium]|nr:DUF998 domain-containing protein [Actinomycetota bacterium]
MLTRPVIARFTAAGSGVLYSSFLLSYLTGAQGHIAFISELERPGAPYAGWYRASDLGAGVLMVALAWLCWSRPQQPITRWALVAVSVTGIGSMLDATSTMDCAPTVRSTCDITDHTVTGLISQLLSGHTVTGLVGFAAAGIGAGCCARAGWQTRETTRRIMVTGTTPPLLHQAASAHRWMRAHIVLAAVIGTCGLLDVLFLLTHTNDVAIVERVRILAVSGWIVLIPWIIHAVPQDHHAGHRRTTEKSAKTAT